MTDFRLKSGDVLQLSVGDAQSSLGEPSLQILLSPVHPGAGRAFIAESEWKSIKQLVDGQFAEIHKGKTLDGSRVRAGTW